MGKPRLMYSHKKKKSQLTLGSQVLQSLFESGNSELSEQFIRWKLWKKWGEFVGPSISQVCEPVGYRRGVLYVWVKNSTWMQQLIFMLDPMRDKINKSLGIQYVKTIHLTLDRRSVPKDQQAEDLKKCMDNIISDEDVVD